MLTIIDESNGYTVFHYAVKNGMLLVVHILVLAGIDLDVFDYEQNTPLMLAILSEENDIVRYLIKVGSNISLKVI